MSQSVSQPTPDMRARLGVCLHRIGLGLGAYIDTHSRRDRVEALEAKSDEELARMGLTRDRIVEHVFRDVIWI